MLKKKVLLSGYILKKKWKNPKLELIQSFLNIRYIFVLIKKTNMYLSSNVQLLKLRHHVYPSSMNTTKKCVKLGWSQSLNHNIGQYRKSVCSVTVKI